MYYANHLADVSHVVKIRREYALTHLREFKEVINDFPATACKRSSFHCRIYLSPLLSEERMEEFS